MRSTHTSSLRISAWIQPTVCGRRLCRPAPTRSRRTCRRQPTCPAATTTARAPCRRHRTFTPLQIRESPAPPPTRFPPRIRCTNITTVLFLWTLRSKDPPGSFLPKTPVARSSWAFPPPSQAVSLQPGNGTPTLTTWPPNRDDDNQENNPIVIHTNEAIARFFFFFKKKRRNSP